MSDLKRKWPVLNYNACVHSVLSEGLVTPNAAFQAWLEANIPEPLLSQLAPREPMRIESRHVVNRGVSGFGWIEAIMLDSEWSGKEVKVTIEEIL
jgi:hypothetical protein